MQVRKNNYTVNATPTLQVLTEQQIEAIYYAALGVLSETGVRVYDKEGWDLAHQGGASVEDVQDDNALVKMPSWMVDKARATLPQRIRVIGPAGRDGVRKYKMDLFKNEIYYGTGSDTPFTIDPYTLQRRRALYKDVKNLAKLAEALPTITTTPAKAIGLDGERGRIEPGFTADLVLLTRDLHVHTTIAEGEVVYSAG